MRKLRRRKKLEVCLVVDRSGSLESVGDFINNALPVMLENIKKHPRLSGCEVYFTLVTFNERMQVICDCIPIENVSASSLTLTFEGQTNPAGALEYVVDRSIKRYERWKDGGDDAFHPIIYFFTDGDPYPENKYMQAYKNVAKKIKQFESNNKLTIVSAGFGIVNMENLRLLSNKEYIAKMDGNDVSKLTEFFQHLIPKTIITNVSVTGVASQMADHFAQFNLN